MEDNSSSWSWAAVKGAHTRATLSWEIPSCTTLSTTVVSLACQNRLPSQMASFLRSVNSWLTPTRTCPKCMKIYVNVQKESKSCALQSRWPVYSLIGRGSSLPMQQLQSGRLGSCRIEPRRSSQPEPLKTHLDWLWLPSCKSPEFCRLTAKTFA